MLLNYQQLGQGSDVVLIHGLFGSLENLNVIAKALAENYKWWAKNYQYNRKKNEFFSIND